MKKSKFPEPNRSSSSRAPYQGPVEGWSLWRLAPEHVDLVAKNQDSASRRALDRNSPMSAPQSSLSSCTIEQQHHPIPPRFASYIEFPTRTRSRSHV
jgi:hypothetical protein